MTLVRNLAAQGIASTSRPSARPAHGLGDFLASARLAPIAVLAVVVGMVSAGVARVLLRLIGLFTNLFFFQRWNFELV
jgi:chloride channel protein, CIC family